jgi:archaellum component FlaC
MDEFGVIFKSATFVIGAGLAILSGVIKFISAQIKDLQARLDTSNKNHADFRVEVAQNYVRHENLDKIEARMDKFEDRMSEGFDDIRKILSTKK